MFTDKLDKKIQSYLFQGNHTAKKNYGRANGKIAHSRAPVSILPSFERIDSTIHPIGDSAIRLKKAENK